MADACRWKPLKYSLQYHAFTEAQLRSLGKWPARGWLRTSLRFQSGRLAFDADAAMQACLREIGSAVLNGRSSVRGCEYEDPLDLMLRPPVDAAAFDSDRLPTPLESPCLLLPKGFSPSDGWHAASYAWLPALGKSTAGKRIRWRMHSYVCAAVHGLAPAADLLALHHPVCQRSRQCVNPLHLRWGTRADNRSDIAKAKHLRTARLAGSQHMLNQYGVTATCCLCRHLAAPLFRLARCHA